MLNDNDMKLETQPKQLKVIPTPRIKLKHNDITDEEFRLLMEHQRSLQEVSNNTNCIVYNNYIINS